MDGILNVNKPSGMTSHDVVQAVRRIVKEKRVGHTGTLDPLATGVLVLCVGKATKIARYLEAGEKAYAATMRLGMTTDTLDVEGRVLETRSYEPPNPVRLLRTLQSFTGAIMQQPPAYSAIKVGGVPSYKLAREGKAEPLKPRQITIYGIELTAYEDPLVSFTVKCSKGVYVRTLCADLGDALGSGAHLTSLVRTRSGRFAIDQAITLDQLASAFAAGAIDRVMIPVDEALADLPETAVGEAESTKILHGRRIPSPQSFTAGGAAALVRVRDRSGRLLALARAVESELQPELVFS